MSDASPEAALTYERRALILDDNDGNRMLLKFVMQMNALDQVEADRGKVALEIWKPGGVAFAFLDIELPDISGLEVARQMRAADSGVAIIMCSTNDDPVTINIAIAAGCDVFLVKPFQLDTLMTLIKGLDREKLRNEPRVMVVDNVARTHWQARLPAAP